MTLTANDRSVIITGAGSGIGRASALQVAALGAHAVVSDLNAETAGETVRLIEEAGGGSIVNIASEAGIRGAAAGAAYTASKHGVVGLTRNTAYVYARQGVRTNAVLPGGVATNIMDSIDPSKIDQAGMGAITPVHQTAIRNAEPTELAALVAFLIADESSNVNGAIIPSDGGWSAG